MRKDEFSRNELRGSHASTQVLTSQEQEVQERMSYLNDSKEFQDFEPICSGNYLTFPVSGQWFQVLEQCRAATKACDLIHGMGHRETFLAIHVE